MSEEKRPIIISIILLAIPILFASVVCTCIDFYGKKHEFVLPQEGNNETIRNAQAKCRTWFNMSAFWLAVEYLGVILPFECSAIIVYLEIYANSSEGVFTFSVISMLLIIITYAIRPHFHAIAYRKAYVTLNKAIYNEITKNAGSAEIREAIHKGEMFINGAFDIDGNNFDNL